MSKTSPGAEPFSPGQISKIYRFFCDIEGEIAKSSESQYSGYTALRGSPSKSTKFCYVALRDDRVFEITTDKAPSARSKNVQLLSSKPMEEKVAKPYFDHVSTDYCFHKLSQFQSQRLESEVTESGQETVLVAQRKISSYIFTIQKNIKNGQVTVTKKNERGKRVALKIDDITRYAQLLFTEIEKIELQQQSLKDIFNDHPLANQESRIIKNDFGEFTIKNENGILIILKDGKEVSHEDESDIQTAIACFLNHNAMESSKVVEDTSTARNFIAQCSAIARQIETGGYQDSDQAKKDYELLVKSLPSALEILLQGPSRRTDVSAAAYNETLRALDKAAEDVANLIEPLASSAGLGFACAHGGQASKDLSGGDLKNIKSQIAKIIYSTDDQKLIESAAGILQSFHQVDNEASYRSNDVYNLTRSNADYLRTLSVAFIDSAAGHYQHRDKFDNSSARLDLLISSLTSSPLKTPRIELKTALDCEKYFGDLAEELGPNHPLIVTYRISNQGYGEGLCSNLIQDVAHISNTGSPNDGFIDAAGRDRTCHLKIIESEDGGLKLVNKVDLKIAFFKVGDTGLEDVSSVLISTLVSTPLTGKDQTPNYSFHIGDLELSQPSEGYEQEVVAKMDRYFSAMREKYQETSQSMLREFETAKLSSLSNTRDAFKGSVAPDMSGGVDLDLDKYAGGAAADESIKMGSKQYSSEAAGGVDEEYNPELLYADSMLGLYTDLVAGSAKPTPGSSSSSASLQVEFTEETPSKKQNSDKDLGILNAVRAKLEFESKEGGRSTADSGYNSAPLDTAVDPTDVEIPSFIRRAPDLSSGVVTPVATPPGSPSRPQRNDGDKGSPGRSAYIPSSSEDAGFSLQSDRSESITSGGSRALMIALILIGIM